MRAELVFLLEERSAEALLGAVLPRLLSPQVAFRLIAFEGNQDLERQMIRRMRGYLNPDARFVVVRDQDSHPDCILLKANLLQKCAQAGKQGLCLVRIACRELETFYLADLLAVEQALEMRGLSKYQQQAKFRSPDRLGSPSRELRVLTKGVYQKVGDSRRIGNYLDLQNARSSSFSNLMAGIKRLEAELLRQAR